MSWGGDKGGWGRQMLLLDARECSWTWIQSRLYILTMAGGQCLAGGPSGGQKAGNPVPLVGEFNPFTCKPCG